MKQSYYVNDIYTTIQGEGCLTGVAMVLVRLQGCGVGCPWCDTKETWQEGQFDQTEKYLSGALGSNEKYVSMTAEKIAEMVKNHYPGPKWILVTGGEPGEQHLAPLVTKLHKFGYKVALETSGTMTGQLKASFDWVCVSPKIGMPGGRLLHTGAIEEADEIKMVVGRQNDIDNLIDLIDNYNLKENVQICLQPVSRSEKATDLCMEYVTRMGWRLSLQVHKFTCAR